MYENWIKEFPGAVTVCDRDGIILYLNDKAMRIFEPDGGALLLGQNVLDCHPPRAREILKDMMENQKTNIYTIEKNGIKKLLYQAPWYEDGIYSGFVELTLEIPFEMPHFDRNIKK